MIIWFLIFVMQAFFALTFPIGKLALHYTGPLFLVGLRMVVAGALLLGYYVLTLPWKRVSRADWFLIFKMSLFAVYLSFVPEFWALKTMPAIKTNMLWSLLPFVSALLSYSLLHERLSKNKWIGLTIGFVGMLPVFFMTTPQEMHMGEILYVSLPDLMMIIAVVSCAYGWFLMKELLQKGYAIVFINGITMLCGGLLCFITRFLEQSPEPLYTDFGPVFGYTMILIILSNVIGYNLYGYLMRSCSLTFLSFTGFLCPLFGALFSRLLLHEQLHYQYGIAFFCVVLGLWLFYHDELQSHTKDTMFSCKKLKE